MRSHGHRSTAGELGRTWRAHHVAVVRRSCIRFDDPQGKRLFLCAMECGENKPGSRRKHCRSNTSSSAASRGSSPWARYLGMNRWDIQASRQNNFELLPTLIKLSAPNPDNCADLINVMPRADLGRSRSPVGPEMPKFWSLPQRCSQGVCSCVQSDRSKEFSTVRLAT